MVNTFFNKKLQEVSAYDKLLLQNEINTMKKRISQANEALQQLKEDIDSRTQKLNEIFTFIENKEKTYQQWTVQYEQTPTPALAKKLTSLKNAIDEFVTQLEKAQPEKVIADLSSHYEELKSELTRKQTLFSNTDSAESLANAHSVKIMP